MFFSLVFLPAKLAKTPEKKKTSTLPQAKNICNRSGGCPAGAAGGRQSPENLLFSLGAGGAAASA